MQPMKTWFLALSFVLAGSACDGGGSEPGSSPNAGRHGCIEHMQSLNEDTPLQTDPPFADVLRLVRDEHTAELTWADGNTTEVKLATIASEAFFVKSRKDPNYSLNDAPACDDRVIVKARTRLTTADGKFDVEIPELLWESKGKWVYGSSGGLPKSALGRSYVSSAAKASECLYHTVVSATLSESQFRGELANAISSAPCSGGANATVGERIAAKWVRDEAAAPDRQMLGL